MTVAIVVDSAASLPADLVAGLGIEIVPMTVIVDGEARPDSAITPTALLELVDHHQVSTSGPNPADFAAAIERALARADAALVLTVSTEMSSTYASAELATTATTSEGTAVRLVDTRSAAGGEGLVALAAAELAATGAGLDDVAARALAVRDQVRLVATLDSLDHLVRSGRVRGIAGMAAHTLRVNPLFEFRDGMVRKLHPAIGQKAAHHRIVEACLHAKPRDVPAPRLHVAALDAAATDRARSLLDDVLAAEPDAVAFLGSFGPVMVAHVGPGVSGLAWWWETLPNWQ